MRFSQRYRLSPFERMRARRVSALKALLARQKEEIDLLERHGLLGAAAFLKLDILETEDLLYRMQPPANKP